MASSAASTAVTSDAPPASPAAGRVSRAPWLLVAAALAGGAVGWWLVEAYDRPFAAPEELGRLLAKRSGSPITAEEEAQLARLDITHEGRNAGAAFAFAGAPLVAFVALAAGLAARSWGVAAIGLPAGVVLGGLAGWGAGWAAVFANHHLKMTFGLDGMYAALLTHALAWVIVALPAGLLTWLAFRRQSSLGRTVGAAVLGAMLAGAVAYPFVAALAFQMNNSELVVPSGHWNRLAWVEVAAGLIAGVMAWDLVRRSAKNRPNSV